MSVMTWRRIYADSSESLSLAGLDDFAERLFWRMVANADSWGRLPGDPAKVRARCIPMLDKDLATVSMALGDLEAAGRIAMYAVDGVVVVQLTDFEERQPDTSRKRGASRLPCLTDDGAVPVHIDPSPTMPEKAGVVRPSPAKGETEESRGEDKRREDHLLAAARRERAPAVTDEVWDALVKAMGCKAPTIKSARGAWNAAAKELRDAEVTPEQIDIAARGYRKAWPGITLTPNALTKHMHLFLGETAEEVATSKLQVAERWAQGAGRSIAPEDRLDVMPYRDQLTEAQRVRVLEIAAGESP